MLKDFDIAFTNKVKAWYSNTIYANTAIIYNVAFELVDQTDFPDIVLKFPMISIYRPSGFSLNKNQNFAARKQGIEYFYDSVESKSNMARFISVNLPYQLDIYAKSPESLDDITEHLMQAFNFASTLEVAQVDSNTGQEYKESYDIIYNNGPVEQSEFTNGDRVYHYSLVYEITNARIVNFKEIKSIDQTEVDVAVEHDDSNEQV
jgi:hypothetical protein